MTDMIVGPAQALLALDLWDAADHAAAAAAVGAQLPGAGRAQASAAGTVLPPLIVLGIAMYPGRLGFYQLAHGAIGMDAIWLSFPVGSLIAVVLAYGAYRVIPWRERAETSRIPGPRAAAPA